MPATPSPSSAQAGGCGRVIGTLFFAVFLAAGLAFTFFMAREIWRGLQPWFWKTTDCAILSSRAAKDDTATDKPWRVAIRYRFTAPDGQSVTSDRVSVGDSTGAAGFDDAGQAQRLARRYPADSRAVCYVNSGHESVLVRKAPWTIFVILFPLIFVAVGGGGIFIIWKPSKLTETSRALSNRRTANPLWIRGFFLIFLAAGLGFGYLVFFQPVIGIIGARDWPSVPCTIVSSEVKTHPGDEGSTYSVAVHYRYRIGDEPFDSNRYNFMSGFSSSGYEGKRAVVDRYPSGSKATCFVNPADPTDAVLERGFTRQLWWGLLPGIFCAVGLGGFLFAKPGGVSGYPTTRESTGLPKEVAPDVAGPATLKAKHSPVGKLVGISIFAAIWNAFVGVFLLGEKHIPFFFVAIFGGVGVLLLCSVVYQILACLNPRPILTVNAQSLRLGGTLQLDWIFRGSVLRIRRLRIILRGTEEATYRRGTDTSTDRHIFTELELFNETDSGLIAGGQAEATIPAETMHTFIAPNNKIVWSLHFKGEIPRWPDVDEEFAITVLPALRS